MAAKNKKYNKKRASEKFDKRESNDRVEDRGDSKNNRSNGRAPRKNGMNDVSWYASSPQMLRDAGSFSFYNPLGSGFTVTSQESGWKINNDTGYKFVPGVCAINLLTTPGISTRAVDPINVAAGAMFSHIRKENAGAKNYDPVDLGMYILAVDAAYSWYAFLARLYGTLCMYDQANTYMPDALLKANGVDPHDLRTHMANFRTYLNQWINKLATILIPNNLPFINRHVWCFSNYYLDDPMLKSQIMMYRPEGYHKWNPTLSDTGSACEFVSLQSYYDYDEEPNHLMSLDDLINISEDIINPLYNGQDVRLMGGDILKAYGPEGILKLSEIPTEFTILPVYNPEVLEQMKHATLMGHPITATCHWTQNDGILIASPVFSTTVSAEEWEQLFAAEEAVAMFISKMSTQLLNFDRTGIEPADVMVATRLMCVPRVEITSYDGTSPTFAWTLRSCGTEIATTATFYTKHPIYENSLVKIELISSNMYAGSRELSYLIGTYTDFHWAPRLTTWETTVNRETTTPLELQDSIECVLAGYIDDMANYSFIDGNALTRLHNCALLSEFDVPRLALER